MLDWIGNTKSNPDFIEKLRVWQLCPKFCEVVAHVEYEQIFTGGELLAFE
jgi:hypothetical protein